MKTNPTAFPPATSAGADLEHSPGIQRIRIAGHSAPSHWRTRFMTSARLLCAAVALMLPLAGPNRAHASVIWGNSASGGNVNLEAFDAATGLLIPGQQFLVPNLTARNDNGRGVAVLGNDIYYTTANSGNIYKTNVITHADLGILVSTGFAGIANVATDGTYIYASDYQTSSGIVNEYDTSGNLIGSVNVGSGFGRDGFEVQNNPNIAGGATTFISNRGDLTSPYDVYDSSGNLLISAFINPVADGFSNEQTGIAYDGNHYFVSEVYNNRLLEYSGLGVFIRIIDLSINPPPPSGQRLLEDLSAVGNTISNPNECGDGVLAPPEQCDDGNTTSGDGCSAVCTIEAGGCVPANCDDGITCTVDHCSSAGGVFVCTHTPTDSLCNDGNACTDDHCAANGCTNTPNTNPCDDQSACTQGDTCDGQGNCVGTTVQCPPADQCHTGSGTCDPGTGTCTYATKPDGSVCTDDDPCTVDDVCQGGTCTSQPRNCDDDDPCTLDSCSVVFNQFKCDHVNCDSLPGKPCPPAFPQCIPVGCGNGRLDPGETCDPPNPNPIPGVVPPQPICRPDCTSCGDGAVNASDGETCDDGNTVSGCDPAHGKRALDGCLNNCTVPICDDPSRITMSAGLDRFDFHGMLTSTLAPVDVGGSDIVLELTSAFGQPLFRATLAGGSLTVSSTGSSFRYANKAAATSGGLSKLKMRRLSDGSLRTIARAYGDLSNAQEEMVTHLYVAEEEWTTRGSWVRLGNGWKFAH
jgi:cysteine-rich repeat protein